MIIDNTHQEYVFTQPLHHGQDVTQGQFLSGIKLVWIQSFPYESKSKSCVWQIEIFCSWVDYFFDYLVDSHFSFLFILKWSK